MNVLRYCLLMSFICYGFLRVNAQVSSSSKLETVISKYEKHKGYSNKAYPLNLEKEKVGFEIDYADVKGWQQCVNYLINNPAAVQEMGERALLLCKKRYNYSIFSNEVVSKINLLRKAPVH